MYKPNEIVYHLPEWIVTQTKANGLSLSQLAKLSGVHKNTITHYIQGTHDPSLFNLICLCNVLGYEINIFKRNDGETNDT